MALSLDQQRMVLANLGIAGAVLSRLGLPLAGSAWSEAQLALCEAVETYTADRAKFSTHAWLRVRWHMLSWRRSERTYRRLGVLCEAPEVEEGEEPPEPLPERLRLALEALPGPVKAVIDLGLLGLSKEQVAAALGVSVSTVARRRKEARELLGPLRSLLEDENHG